jgi:hypothetical protein
LVTKILSTFAISKPTKMEQKEQAGLDFEIDILTHSIVDVKTGESLPTDILPLTAVDLKTVSKKNGWLFNWKTELNDPRKEVFKLIAVSQPNIIQGLVSITKEYGYIIMNLIETAPFNLGKNKLYKGVAGNLVAYVCTISYEMGYDGELVFISKTKLISHYEQTLGAVHIGSQRMIIFKPAAQKLIEHYYPNFKL